MDRFLIFSDESGYDASNRYGCIAKVSGEKSCLKELNEELKSILAAKGKSEFKFKKIKNKDSIDIAKSFLGISLSYLKRNKIRVNVIAWDKQDKRHQIANRCDIENMKRMYFHNLKAVKRSWNTSCTWGFYPDEFSAIDWYEDVVQYMENTNLTPPSSQLDLFGILPIQQFPTYKNVAELDSKEYPIVQLADLYAGLVQKSREKQDDYVYWVNQNTNIQQQFLFEFTESKRNLSKSSIPKFEVMHYFKEESKKYGLGVNFSKDNYFQTFNNRSNISIWHYIPQGDYDKAPTKRK